MFGLVLAVGVLWLLFGWVRYFALCFVGLWWFLCLFCVVVELLGSCWFCVTLRILLCGVVTADFILS